MSQEIVDLLNNAVMLGIGAILGGSFTVLAAYLQHKHSLDAEYSRRIRDSIEVLSERFEKVNAFYLERMAIAQAGHRRPEHIRDDLYEGLVMKYRDLSVELHQIEGRFALMGVLQISAMIESYRRIGLNILKFDTNMRNKKESGFSKEILESINSIRKEYYNCLSIDYKRG